MPFKSDKQRKLMYAVANNPAVAKKTGISKAVADKFIQHKAEGGSMATKKFREDEGSAAYKAKERRHVEAMKKAGVPKNIIAEEKKEAGLKKGGKVKCMADGGPVMPRRPVPPKRKYPDAEVSPEMAKKMQGMLDEQKARKQNEDAYNKASTIPPRPGMKKGGKVKGYAMGGPVVPEAPRSGIIPKEMMPVGPDGQPAVGIERYDSRPPVGSGEPDMPMQPATKTPSAPPKAGAINALLSRLPARGASPTPMPGSDVVGGQGIAPEMMEKIGKVSPGISRGMAEAIAKAAMANQGRSQARPGRVATPNTRFGGANRNQAYAKGGKVKGIDGCATKGKTKGRMV